VSGSEPQFVVQKHAATSLHYDFRLEIGGALVSWAVPKGPSTDPKDKRLAMRVEDHSIDWGEFEGVIPEESYGAGAVIVWDRGVFRNEGESPLEEGLEDGHLRVRLEGEKLRGGWSLRRMKGQAKESWLLMKRRDETADPNLDLVSDRPESVVSGKTIENLLGTT
jgi:DNA ligase D-like protein (predicted 3'-phosphoesterase)